MQIFVLFKNVVHKFFFEVHVIMVIFILNCQNKNLKHVKRENQVPLHQEVKTSKKIKFMKLKSDTQQHIWSRSKPT